MTTTTRAYLGLLVYTLATWLVGINFWQVGRESRPIWLIGAVVVLVATVFWKKAPLRRLQHR